ncbi:CsbD family protein [Streptomyces sp. NPDC088725]|uniref:CsbD family protein n=1 Tax=Streptomyces sp. NPDC088725 TaxID=3365873 RepID=UPI0038187BC3
MADDGAMDKMKGKAKEMTGKATGDRRKESEGKTDQTKGKAKSTMDDAGDRAKGMKDSLKHDDS